MTLSAVTRDCICPSRPRAPGEHTEKCAAALKAKLWAAVVSAKSTTH